MNETDLLIAQQSRLSLFVLRFQMINEGETERAKNVENYLPLFAVHPRVYVYLNTSVVITLCPLHNLFVFHDIRMHQLK